MKEFLVAFAIICSVCIGIYYIMLNFEVGYGQYEYISKLENSSYYIDKYCYDGKITEIEYSKILKEDKEHYKKSIGINNDN